MASELAGADGATGSGHVLVTGGNRGLGFATAALLCDQGWTVLLGCRHEGRGDAACAALRDRGGRVERVTLDVADPASIDTAAAQVARLSGGGLDALINNAGVFLDERDRELASLTAEACHELFTVNAVGPLLLTQAMHPLLRAVSGAAVVNVTADDADPATVDGEATGYRMAKAALNIMTANLAVSLRADDIAVNAVDPGWIPTGMGGPDAPDEIGAAAALTAWAATSAGRYDISGQVLSVHRPPEPMRSEGWHRGPGRVR